MNKNQAILQLYRDGKIKHWDDFVAKAEKQDIEGKSIAGTMAGQEAALADAQERERQELLDAENRLRTGQADTLGNSKKRPSVGGQPGDKAQKMQSEFGIACLKQGSIW